MSVNGGTTIVNMKIVMGPLRDKARSSENSKSVDFKNYSPELNSCEMPQTEECSNSVVSNPL